MYFKCNPSLVIKAVLMTLTWECLIVDASYMRRPKDGDSCRNYRYVGSIDKTLHDLFLYLGRDSFPCWEGTVISSLGECVDPRNYYDADRCQDTEGFTQTKVNEICQRRPKATFADPFDCTRYYDCSSGVKDKHVQCPFDPVSRTQLTFHDIDKVCRLSDDVLCGQRPVKYSPDQITYFCRQHPTRVWVDSNTCNSYYNCSQSADPSFASYFPPYAAECPYLQLFDAETKSCRPYAEVTCGLRKEIKNPCELRQNKCRTAHCRPCVIDNPDCSQKADGAHPLDFDFYTPRFVTCAQGRTLGVSLCQSARDANGFVQPRLFHPETKRCVPASAIPRSLGGLGA